MVSLNFFQSLEVKCDWFRELHIMDDVIWRELSTKLIRIKDGDPSRYNRNIDCATIIHQ